MKRWQTILLVVLMAAGMAACGFQTAPVPEPSAPGAAEDAAFESDLYASDERLTLKALEAEREVPADGDGTFDFLVANQSDGDVPVVLVLEHQDGVRWRTSLCIGLQCVLGDGSEPSVSDVVVLPPYLEQPFQAHVFVDGDAEPGHSETLILRVEPQVPGVQGRSLTLNATVVPD